MFGMGLSLHETPAYSLLVAEKVLAVIQAASSAAWIHSSFLCRSAEEYVLQCRQRVCNM